MCLICVCFVGAYVHFYSIGTIIFEGVLTLLAAVGIMELLEMPLQQSIDFVCSS